VVHVNFNICCTIPQFNKIAFPPFTSIDIPPSSPQFTFPYSLSLYLTLTLSFSSFYLSFSISLSLPSLYLSIYLPPLSLSVNLIIFLSPILEQRSNKRSTAPPRSCSVQRKIDFGNPPFPQQLIPSSGSELDSSNKIRNSSWSSLIYSHFERG